MMCTYKHLTQFNLLSAVFLVLFSPSLFLMALAKDKIQVIYVYNSQQLYSAIDSANNEGNKDIILANGEYDIHRTLVIRNDYVTLKSASGDKDAVIFTGNGMKKAPSVDNLIHLSGKHFTLDGVTLQQAGNHLIQIAGENDADFPVLRNCTLRDSYEQLLKVSYNHDKQISSDHGLIENCTFAFSAGIGPQFYIGGIDVHGGHNWVIRNNHFENIASPSSKVSEHAIHFWNSTENILIENNTILNCDRGIGFGMQNRPNIGGVIQNNLILHTTNHHPYADVGIILEDSPNTKVLNNKIYLTHSYNNAIEYRFYKTSNVKISGNITNKSIRKRNGASAILLNNIRSKNLDHFVTKEQYLQLNIKLH